MDLFLTSANAKERVRLGDADTPTVNTLTPLSKNKLGVATADELGYTVGFGNPTNPQPPLNNETNSSVSLSDPQTMSPSKSRYGVASADELGYTVGYSAPSPNVEKPTSNFSSTGGGAAVGNPNLGQRQNANVGDYSAGDFGLDSLKMLGISTLGILKAPAGFVDAGKKLVRDVASGDVIDTTTPELKTAKIPFTDTSVPYIDTAPTGLNIINLAKMALLDVIGIDSLKNQFKKKEDAKIAVDRAFASAPDVPGVRSLSEYADSVQEDIRNSISDVGKNRLANTALKGNIFKGEFSFGNNPTLSGFALQVAGVLGSLAPVVATAMITRSPTAASAVGGFTAAGEGSDNARDFMEKQTHESLLVNSPYYSTMISRGVPKEEAKQIITEKAAESSALYQGMVAAVGSNITANLVNGAFNNIISRIGKTTLGRTGVGFAGGAVEEGVQEVLEGVGSDIGIAQQVKNKEIGEDSFANLVLGAIGGGTVGGIKGAFIPESQNNKTSTTQTSKFGTSTENISIEELNKNVTNLNDSLYSSTNQYFQEALKKDKDRLVNLFSYVYGREQQADANATAENNVVIKNIEKATQRLGIFEDVMQALGGPTVLSNRQKEGEQFFSNQPNVLNGFINSVDTLANTLPAQTTAKFDKRGLIPKSGEPLSEEEVMNLAPPEQTTATPSVKTKLELGVDEIKNSENPGVTAAQIIKSLLYSDDPKSVENWTQLPVDKYGVTTYKYDDQTPEDLKLVGPLEVYAHPKFPGYYFNSKNDIFNSFALLKSATEQFQQNRLKNINLDPNAQAQNMSQQNLEDDIKTGSVDPDTLYSKGSDGRIKAAFFKNLKRVYYSSFAWRTGDMPGSFTQQQFQALEMHEIGAHYAIEQMLGSEQYQKLLSDMSKLRGKDKMVTEAYDSVPSDTIPSLIDHEALGYLVENYANNTFVKRLFQMIRDWFDKKFNGKELTATDINNLVRTAFKIHSKEIRRVYLRGNISDQPREGTKQVDFQDALKSTPEAYEFLDFVSQFKDLISLTGSLALSAQLKIFRPTEEQIHDLDFNVRSQDDLNQILEAIAKQYPESSISNNFSSGKTNSNVVTIELNKNDPSSITVDFFVSIDSNKDKDYKTVEHTYTTMGGAKNTINLTQADFIFDKKMSMGRAKDVNDAIQSDVFDVAFSKEKPTVTDLISALPLVIKRIIETGESKKLEDMQTIVTRRILQNPKWSPLANQITPALIKIAYQKAIKQLNSAEEESPTNNLERIKKTSREDVANNKIAAISAKAETPEIGKRKTATKDKPVAREVPVEEKQKTDLVNKIREIYKQNTNGSFYEGLLKSIHQQIDSLDEKIKRINFFEITNPDGSVSTYYRQKADDTAMDQQLESFGRVLKDDAYYEKINEAVFELPESKQALLVRRRLLQLELKAAQQDKISEQAKLGRLGIGVIRRQIQDAILEAEANGVPIEITNEVGREWLGGIDQYLQLDKIISKDQKDQRSQELKDFMEQMSQSVQEADMPSDTEFSFDINKDIRTGKISVDEAIDLVDEADRRGELDSKKKVINDILTELVGDYATMFNKVSGEELLSKIYTWAVKTKKEGLIRYDELVDIFHSNNQDVPLFVVKMGEVAASKGMLDYLAENKFDPAFRYYWLRSMDRVVQFNPSSLESRQFTDLERDLYSDWKSQTTAVGNRRKNALEKNAYGNLLWNNFSLADMKNPENIPTNIRMKLQQMHPDLVEAYFYDIEFSLRNGFGRKNLILDLNEADRKEFLAWQERRNKSQSDSAERLQRQKYFSTLSQFRHIGDEQYQNLYQMMIRDSVANLPMILDMAQKIEELTIKDEAIPDSLANSINKKIEELSIQVKQGKDIKVLSKQGAVESSNPLNQTVLGGNTQFEQYDSKTKKYNVFTRASITIQALAGLKISEREAIFPRSLPFNETPMALLERTIKKESPVVQEVKQVPQQTPISALQRIAKNLKVEPSEIVSVEYGNSGMAVVFIRSNPNPLNVKATNSAIDLAQFEVMSRSDTTDEQSNALEDMVVSAFVKSQVGTVTDSKRGMVSDATMKSAYSDPVFEFNLYKDVVEGRFVSYQENDGGSNRINSDEESSIEQMNENGDAFLFEESNDEPTSDEDTDSGENDDNLRNRLGQYVGYLSTALVINYVNEITKNWKNAPSITVLQSHLQLPEGLREEVSKKLQNGIGAKGLFDASTGAIYLFSNFISSKADAQFTLFHEAYGHLGLRLMFGESFDAFLENMYKTHESVKREADQRMGKGNGRLEAIEEALSDMAGLNQNVGPVKEFIGMIITNLRKIGFNKVANYLGGFTDSELSYVLKAARDFAENAGGRSPLLNGPRDFRLSEERPPYEIFAKSGTNTVAYARYDPIIDKYNVFIAPAGSDVRKKSSFYLMDSLDDVIKRLEKLGKIERRVRSGLFRDNTLPEDFPKFKSSRELSFFASKWEAFRRAQQNQYLPVYRIVEQMEKIGRITPAIDLRRFLRTTERQAGVALDDSNAEVVAPIFDLLGQAEKLGGKFTEGATNIYEMLNTFLLAQTADERNIAVNKVNLEVFDGSGMASKSSVKADPAKHKVDTASNVLNFVKSQPYGKQFEQIGKILNDVSEKKLTWEVETGQITQEDADRRRKAYKFYRNLGGFVVDKDGKEHALDEDYSNDPSLNVYRKFNSRGKDKRATGRADEAPDILARTLLAYEASIIRGHKGLISQRVLNFFETNYDPNFISINEQAKVKVVGPDGFVIYQDKQGYYNQDDVMVAKVKGIPVTMRFKDSGYNSVYEALHGKVEPQSEHPIRHMWQVAGRAFGSMITKYNPYWIPINFSRDVGTLFISSAIQKKIGVKDAGRMMKELVPAMGTTIRMALEEMQVYTAAGKFAKQGLIDMMEGRVGSTLAIGVGAAALGAVVPGVNVIAAAAIGSLIGSFASNSEASQKRIAIYKEARKYGAFTGFLNRRDLEDSVIDIHKAIYGRSALEKLGGFFKFWELVTIPVEMAPRLAAYTVVRKTRSPLDSADFAGGITVDFNMRGADEWGRALFTFLNPAVQGTTQLFSIARNNPARFTIAMSGLMLAGYLTSMFARSNDSGDDDDGELTPEERKELNLSAVDRIPAYKKSTSAVLFPGVKGGAIPLPFGYNAPFAAGFYLADSIHGSVPWAISTKRTFEAIFAALSPVGGTTFDITKVPSDPIGQTLNLFTPTLIAPIARWELNKNTFNGPIYPGTNYPGNDGVSDTTKAFSSVNPISKWIAENLQEATGGDRRNTVGIDLNPAMLDHFFRSYVPGLPSMWYEQAGMEIRKSKGLDIPREKEPLSDRFSAYPDENYYTRVFMALEKKVGAVVRELEDTPNGSPRIAELTGKYKELGSMELVLKGASKELREVRSDLNESEKVAYAARKEGLISEANKLDKLAVEERNKVKKYEKRIFQKVALQAARSGFRDELYPE